MLRVQSYVKHILETTYCYRLRVFIFSLYKLLASRPTFPPIHDLPSMSDAFTGTLFFAIGILTSSKSVQTFSTLFLIPTTTNGCSIATIVFLKSITTLVNTIRCKTFSRFSHGWEIAAACLICSVRYHYLGSDSVPWNSSVLQRNHISKYTTPSSCPLSKRLTQNIGHILCL